MKRAFATDVNETLQAIQESTRAELTGCLFSWPAQRYLAAAQLLGVCNETTTRLRDHWFARRRALDGAYDVIAAYHRFADDVRGQMPLPFDDVPYARWLETRWRDFYGDQVRQLTEDDAIVVAIVTASAYECTDIGRAAQQHLIGLLELRYGPLAEKTEEEAP